MRDFLAEFWRQMKLASYDAVTRHPFLLSVILLLVGLTVYVAASGFRV